MEANEKKQERSHDLNAWKIDGALPIDLTMKIRVHHLDCIHPGHAAMRTIGKNINFSARRFDYFEAFDQVRDFHWFDSCLFPFASTFSLLRPLP